MSERSERIISLAHLTLFDLTPPDLVGVAAEAGFSHVGIRLTPSSRGPAYPMHPGSPMLAETVRRMAACGVRVLDIEVLRLRPDTDLAAVQPVLHAGAELGAAHVIVTAEDPDPDRAVDLFGRVCQLAAGYGLGCVLEFMVFSQAPTLTAAVQLVTRAAQPNGGVLIDALHLARSGGTLEEVSALPSGLAPYVQLCDAAVDGPVDDVAAARDEAVAHRLVTGDGQLPLADLVRALPVGTPVSLEIPDGWDNPQPVVRAGEVLRGADRLLTNAEASYWRSS